MSFVQIPVDIALNLYKGSANYGFIIASNVRPNLPRVTVQTQRVSAEVAQQMVEEALLKQAGIVLTRLDAKRGSVRYNDKLELEPEATEAP